MPAQHNEAVAIDVTRFTRIRVDLKDARKSSIIEEALEALRASKSLDFSAATDAQLAHRHPQRLRGRSGHFREGL
ncbi:hypothetical protein [Novosphingobium sp. PhB165]|uniref:hypothetical protein n=1 Tax=Novosphingobium sp. PhB165 TaxID=2485105 RepID=UPI0014054B23|nr:hypothetical protein [Novosphingobium sp. PhB165]